MEKSHPPRRRAVAAFKLWSAKGLSMEKWLCWISMGIAGFLLLLFLIDLLLAFPFGRVNPVVDVISLIAAAIVLYLSWDASRDLR